MIHRQRVPTAVWSRLTFPPTARPYGAMTAIKIVKVLGTSEESWPAAAEEAVETASDTIDGIRGVEVESWTADVEDGQVNEYRATVEIAFPVDEERR